MKLNKITLDVEKALINDDISWQQALISLQPVINGANSWTTKEWKIERDKIIDDHCVQCESTKPPMVLQHFSHPETFGKIFRSLCGPDAWPAFKKKYDLILGKDFVIYKPSCPNCGSVQISNPEFMPITCYKCRTKQESVVIKPAFSKEGISELAKKHRNPVLSDARWRVFQQYYGMVVGKKAVLEFINQQRQYLSFADTATFCHSCAYAWDKKGIRLCQSCKKHWHPLYMHECKHCESNNSNA